VVLCLLMSACYMGQKKTVTLEIQKFKEKYFAKLYAQQKKINQLSEDYELKMILYKRAIAGDINTPEDFNELFELSQEYDKLLKEHVGTQAEYIKILEKNIHTLVKVLSKT